MVKFFKVPKRKVCEGCKAPLQYEECYLVTNPSGLRGLFCTPQCFHRWRSEVAENHLERLRKSGTI